MSLTRIVIGFILLALVVLFISELRKRRSRLKKEKELSEAKIESSALDLEEEIKDVRARNNDRRAALHEKGDHANGR